MAFRSPFGSFARTYPPGTKSRLMHAVLGVSEELYAEVLPGCQADIKQRLTHVQEAAPSRGKISPAIGDPVNARSMRPSLTRIQFNNLGDFAMNHQQHAIDVRELPLSDSIHLISKMVGSGMGNHWAVGFLDYQGLNLPADLRQRIVSGMSTRADSQTLLDLARPILAH